MSPKDLTYLKLTDEDIGKIMRKAKEDAIEECARVAEMTKWYNYRGDPNKVVAAAIRALKDNGPQV